jgi:Hint domain-containing protein
MLDDPTVTVDSGQLGDGDARTVVLSDGAVLNLTGITNGSGIWHVLTTPDRAGTGTDVFLSMVCYAAGTRILTATGERVIESLLQGDIVLTLSDGELKAQPIKWVGRRRIDLTAHPRPETVAPVRVQRSAFADNMPHTDLLLSPDHAAFVEGMLICIRQLVNGSTIRIEPGLTAIDYYHVELDKHAILVAEGLPAESYLDTGNRGFFSNSGEPPVLHPDLTDEADYPTREAGSCAPLVWDEASVQPVWQRLADRASVIGRPATQRATTTDADLRLLADRRPVKPVFSDSDRVIFVLPRDAHEVRLVSRAQSPTEARPWLDDRRRLGVRVKRILLRGADETREIPVDHPDLTRGWWAIERDGQMMAAAGDERPRHAGDLSGRLDDLRGQRCAGGRARSARSRLTSR